MASTRAAKKTETNRTLLWSTDAPGPLEALGETTLPGHTLSASADDAAGLLLQLDVRAYLEDITEAAE